jgi:hypothetical protein
MFKLLCLLLSFPVFAQSKPTLEEYSHKLNGSLPEVYDAVTKLRMTSVENSQLVYNFLVDASLQESSWALPKVKAQVLSRVCKNSYQKNVLQKYRTSLIYRYENLKGQSLGEFLIPPEHCPSR